MHGLLPLRRRAHIPMIMTRGGCGRGPGSQNMSTRYEVWRQLARPFRPSRLERAGGDDSGRQNPANLAENVCQALQITPIRRVAFSTRNEPLRSSLFTSHGGQVFSSRGIDVLGHRCAGSRQGHVASLIQVSPTMIRPERCTCRGACAQSFLAGPSSCKHHKTPLLELHSIVDLLRVPPKRSRRSSSPSMIHSFPGRILPNIVARDRRLSGGAGLRCAGDGGRGVCRPPGGTCSP